MSEEKKCGLCGGPLYRSPTDKRVHSHRVCVTNLQYKIEVLKRLGGELIASRRNAMKFARARDAWNDEVKENE